LDGTVTTSVTVVKCGGSEAIQADGVCADIAALRREGAQVVLVHGGSGEIERLAAQLGVPQRTLLADTGASSRYSDAATVDVLTLALAGRAKPRLLLALAAHGVPAVGLTGADAGLLRARRNAAQRAVVEGRTVVVRDDLSGRIVGVNTALLRLLLDAGVTPVVSPPAVGAPGELLNVDADRVAAAVAVALCATRLVLLTAAPGVLRDTADQGSLLSSCELPATGVATPTAGGAMPAAGGAAPGPARPTGGMRRKLQAARDALAGGVPRVVVADGRGEHPLARALAGAGTTVALRPVPAGTA
jgi:acetylglutamate/LysW-gamma-L-alpha-aminoadipate kinase